MPGTVFSASPRDCVALFVTKLLPLAVCLLAPGYIAAQGPKYNIQDLGTLPNLPACQGTALSQSGNVVGYCTSQTGQDLVVNTPATHVFLYANGAMTDLNVTNPSTAFPTGVNNAGAVVGGSFIASDLTNLTLVMGSASPFIYESGALQQVAEDVGLLPLGLNNAGQSAASTLQLTVGGLNWFQASSAFLLPVSGDMAAVELQAPGFLGTPAALGINSYGGIAGANIPQGAINLTPVLWQSATATPQTLPMLSNYQNAIATSVNDSGVAAGLAFNINFTLDPDPNATSHAVLFSDGSVTDLGVLPGDANSMATGINNAGAVVGFSSTATPTFTLNMAALLSPPASQYHAFVFSGGTMYNLQNQLVNGSGWELSYAAQINNAGQIVGTGLINGAQHAFLLTPVLSPTTSAIVGAAFSVPPVTDLSPNGVFTIFGTQLTNAAQGIAPGDILNNQLPTILGGTCVESGSTRWNLFYVSPGQINALAGAVPSSGSIPVKVVTNCGTANEEVALAMNVPVAAESPEFLYYLEASTGLNSVAAIEAATYAYVGPPGLIPGANFVPANPGDVLTAYGVGWGATDPPTTIGELPSAIAGLPAGSYSLTLGGKPVAISYIGLSPGDAGLYQVNFTVPAGVPSGSQPLVLTLNDVTTTKNASIYVGN
jgi:uncharacterized protein (TIGR03437 family)